MKMKTTLYLSLLALLILSSAFLWPKKSTITPPGTFEVSENFYCDKHVISNFAWLEYMAWLEKIYGKESLEYKAAQPNADVWGEEFICLLQLRNYYHKHKAYGDYPAVGISQKQAEEYLKWRSDRVMQYFLISRKVIPNYNDSTPEDFFTIEKYFAGKYHNALVHKKYMQYPVYSLPTPEQYLSISKDYPAYTDSLPKIPCYFDSLRAIPLHTAPKQIDFADGLSEWTKTANTIVGNNWRKPQGEIVGISKKASNYIGFRAICTWESYNEEK